VNPGTAAHPDHWSQFSKGGTDLHRVDGVDVNFDCQDEAVNDDVDDDVEMQCAHTPTSGVLLFLWVCIV
jgi:hypothetical protein